MWWLWPPGAPGGWWPSWWPGWQSPLRTLPLRWKPPLTWPWRFWNCLRDFSWKIINLVAVGENNFPVLWTVIGRLHDFQIFPILFRSHGITWTKRTVYQVLCATYNTPHHTRAPSKLYRERICRRQCGTHFTSGIIFARSQILFQLCFLSIV